MYVNGSIVFLDHRCHRLSLMRSVRVPAYYDYQHCFVKCLFLAKCLLQYGDDNPLQQRNTLLDTLPYGKVQVTDDRIFLPLRG